MTASDDRDPVDVLAEEFADRLRRGEHPSVGDYAIANPDHADQLRELLPAVAQMEFLKRFRRGADDSEKIELPDRFGDFRILRELGRGGMGVVFEAVQESLGRPVALKVLATHAQLDPTRRERFVREAQAAAKLHHTNIVPVFGVGEQDGIPYYVMQLIRGEGLNTVASRWRREREVIVESAGSTVEFGKLDTKTDRAEFELPVPPNPDAPRYGDWSFVAEMGMQAADALHYAHKQGILHRDVKPANLILDPAGRVWVADFGLAKIVDLHGLTATGDILGTLQYLAPECLTGESDPRSDVYGLGATLYELLTLQPPYPMENPARLVKQVADSDPIHPRQLNAAIPRDLETIVLKAMAREPYRRYLNPRDLAADLRAFLEDRPIKARRQSWIGRAWRSCRRNPATALLSATAVAAFLLAGAVGWVGYVNTKNALDAEEGRRKEADAARVEALKAKNDAVLASEKLESNLRMSLLAFEKVFEVAAGTRPGFGTIQWMRPLGPGGPGGPGGGGPGGPGGGGAGGGRGGPLPPPGGGPIGPDGFTAFGPVQGFPNVFPEVEDKAAILEAILEFYDKFVMQNETNARLQFDAAKAYRRVGEVQSWKGSTDKAETSFRRARAILEELHKQDSSNTAIRVELVETYMFAPPEAFKGEHEALLLRALELIRLPGNYTRPNLLGSVLYRLAQVRDQAGRSADAEAAYRAAIDGLAAPSEGDDLRPTPVVVEQGHAREKLAAILIESMRWNEAREILEDSEAELRRFTSRGPGSRSPRELGFVLANTLQRSAQLHELQNEPIAAQIARDEAARLRSFFDRGFGGPGGFPGKKDGPPRKK